MLLDTLIFVDLLMSEHSHALFIFILIMFLALAYKALKIFKAKGELQFEKKEIITKKSKSAV